MSVTYNFFFLTGEVPEVPRTTGNLPDQAFLHEQHARHPPDRFGIQPVLPKPATAQSLQRQLAGERGHTYKGAVDGGNGL